ncbi:MAG: Na+/H+ antiporter subunit E [Sulfuritalea sp.]|nr:Na+/H+ antiporter subunit E [Sulfuritalea sp.]
MTKVGDGVTAAVLRRAPMFALLWWVLAEGQSEAWGLGAVAVATATSASLYLQPPSRRRFSITGFLGFAGFFLWNSLHGGAQVAWMALRPRPDLRPEFLELELALPVGSPRVLMLNTLGLMPGTLGVRLDGDRLKLHVLDKRLPVAASARALEAHIARLFGVEHRPPGRPRGGAVNDIKPQSGERLSPPSSGWERGEGP